MSVRIDQPAYNEMNYQVNQDAADKIIAVAETDDGIATEVIANVYSNLSEIPSEPSGTSLTTPDADTGLWTFSALGTCTTDTSPGGLNFVAAWEKSGPDPIAMTVSPFYAIPHTLIGTRPPKVPTLFTFVTPLAWLVDGTRLSNTRFRQHYVLRIAGMPEINANAPKGKLRWENARRQESSGEVHTVILIVEFSKGIEVTLSFQHDNESIACTPRGRFNPRTANVLIANDGHSVSIYPI